MSLKSYIEKIRRCFHFCAFWCRRNCPQQFRHTDALQSYNFAGSCSNSRSVHFEQVVWQNTPSLGEQTTITAVVGMLLAIAHFGCSHHASLAEKSLQKNVMQPKEIWGPLHNLSWSDHSTKSFCLESESWNPQTSKTRSSLMLLRSEAKTHMTHWRAGEAQGKNVETDLYKHNATLQRGSKKEMNFCGVDKPNPAKSIPRFKSQVGQDTHRPACMTCNGLSLKLRKDKKE